MGKSTISMAIFNSYVKLPEGSMDGDGMTWWLVFSVFASGLGAPEDISEHTEYV